MVHVSSGSQSDLPDVKVLGTINRTNLRQMYEDPHPKCCEPHSSSVKGLENKDRFLNEEEILPPNAA